MISEANEFPWPGPDLRAIPGRDESTIAYGENLCSCHRASLPSRCQRYGKRRPPNSLDIRPAVRSRLQVLDEVDGSANRDALAPQNPVVFRRGDGQFGVQHWHQVKFAQLVFQYSSVGLKRLEKGLAVAAVQNLPTRSVRPIAIS